MIRIVLLIVAAIIAWLVMPDPCWGMLPVLYFTGQSGCFCCTVPACGNCQSGTTSASYEITIAGIVDDTCGDCESANATFVVAQTASPCIWSYLLDPDICAYTQVTMQVGVDLVSGVFIDVWISNTYPYTFPFPTEAVQWRQDGISGAPIDCQLSSFSVSLEGPVGTDCDGSAATCEVSAV